MFICTTRYSSIEHSQKALPQVCLRFVDIAAIFELCASHKLKKDISLKPLFNTKNYTKDFENCLEKIYKNRLNKLEDQDIFIKQ